MTTHSSTKSPTLATAIAIAVLAASCSGGSDSDDTSLPEVSATQASTTSAETTTSTDATTTTTSTTTATTTTLPETTTTSLPGPTTTEDPTFGGDPNLLDSEAVKLAVANVIERFEEDIIECLSTLPACDVENAMATTNGAFGSGGRAELEEWVTAGFETRGEYEIEIEDVQHVAADPIAIATLCVRNQYVLFSPASAGQPEVIVQDDDRYSRVRYQLRIVDGTWFINASESLETFDGDGATGCAA